MRPCRHIALHCAEPKEDCGLKHDRYVFNFPDKPNRYMASVVEQRQSKERLHPALRVDSASET